MRDEMVYVLPVGGRGGIEPGKGGIVVPTLTPWGFFGLEPPNRLLEFFLGGGENSK